MRRTFILWATLILLVAVFLRLESLATNPPGPHYDEAANLIITRSIAFGGADLFPITNNYQGRESLYFYLNAPLFHWMGDSPFTMRLSSVYINLLTIAGAMGLGRLMFGGRRGWWVGLIAGALMAISFHQILMSRQMFRAVSLPLMQALGLVFLWRGLSLRRGGWPWLVIGGAFCSAALYTYMASRLFPLWLVLAGLILLWADRARWRARLVQGGVFFGAMLLFTVPLAVYALANPDIFFQRLTEVTEGDVTVSLAESIRRHAEMFFIRGDDGNLRYNIPGRPYLTIWEAPFLLIGALVALSGVFRAVKPGQRAGYALLVLSPLMVIPSVVALAGFPPSHMRSLGMVPTLFLLVAVGVAWSIQHWRYISVPLVVIWIALAVTVRGEYQTWSARADLFYQADGDLATASRWLAATQPDGPVYISSYHREHPTVLALYGEDVTWLGLESYILPPVDTAGVAVFSHNFPPPDDWIAQFDAPLDVPAGPDGGPAFYAYQVSGLPDAPVTAADRNAILQIAGLDADPIPAGETRYVTLAWQINAPVNYRGLRPILTLRDPGGIPISSSDPFLTATDRWQVGETIYQLIALEIPPATPPGDYPLDVMWADRFSETFLNYQTETGEPAGVRAVVGAVPVVRPELPLDPAQLTIANRADVMLTSGIRLLGWDVLPETRRPGETLDLTLYWQATDGNRPDDPLLFRLDESILETERLSYPPSQWSAGDVFRTVHRLQVPRDQANGIFTLAVALGADSAPLQAITIEGQPRILSPPPVETTLDLTYGERITLAGYNLTTADDRIQLDLIWRAEQAMDTDYTVFVHLVDQATGQTILQRDAMPQAYAYPTTLWIPGEYITDYYQFEGVPAGEYSLRVGLYDQSSGERLYISGVDSGIIRDYIEIFTEIIES
jgi:4-amino-4-deoxy-L-arabinose transferase-like glycosyltransferase